MSNSDRRWKYRCRSWNPTHPVVCLALDPWQQCELSRLVGGGRWARRERSDGAVRSQRMGSPY